MVERDSLGIDIKYEAESVSGYKVVRPGEYVIHLRSFQGGFAFSDKTGICSPAYTILHPKEVLSYGFLKEYFMSQKFIDSLRLVTYGIRDGKSIFVEEWMKLKTYIPKSHKEQERIKEFLGLIDKRLTIQNKVIERYRSLIRAITQKCFQDEYEYSQILLSEIAPNIAAGKSKPSAGPYPLYGSTGIIGTCSSDAYKGEMILVARVGSIGQIQLINTKGCGITDNTLIVNAGKLNRYVYFFLKTFNFQKITSGTTQPLITGGNLKRISVPILPATKRGLFVSLLDAIERRIDLEQKVLQYYSASKSYVLANMFI